MIVVGFLQNMWVKSPERVREMIKRNPGAREAILALCLLKSHTGNRLRRAFEDTMDNISWNNVCSHISGRGEAAPEPDPEHVKMVLARWEPGVVLAFGRLAKDVLREQYHGTIIIGPHPAARQNNVTAELGRMANELNRYKELIDE